MILSMIAVASAVTFIALCYWCRPTCYVCVHCGGVFSRDDQPVTADDAMAASVGLCTRCRDRASNDFPAATT